MGLISVPAGPDAQRALITFRRLPVDEPLQVVVISRAGTQTLHGPTAFIEAIRSARAPLYRYRFQVESRTQQVWDAQA